MKDREFLERLDKVHNESYHMDYMGKLRSIIEATPADQETPNTNPEITYDDN